MSTELGKDVLFKVVINGIACTSLRINHDTYDDVWSLVVLSNSSLGFVGTDSIKEYFEEGVCRK